jgi:heterodisulfide reductase subunit A-like polyferredoxin
MSQPEASKQPQREELRIGVFFCHCGLNIAGTVDIKQVVEYTKTIPDVVYVKENRYTCPARALNAKWTGKARNAVRSLKLG